MSTSFETAATLTSEVERPISPAAEEVKRTASDTAKVRAKLLYLVAEDHYFWTHRRSIASAAQAAGFDVTVVARAAGHADRIRQAGFRLIPFSLHRDSLNPFRELRTLYRLVRLYRQERPLVVHHVALKPMLYGTIAARLSGVTRIVNSVAGLGGLLKPHGVRARCMALCASLAMRGTSAGSNSVTIFQTEHDREAFALKKLMRSPRVTVIRGAGVDLDQFAFQPEANGSGPPIVMLAGRLLRNKGVEDLVEAGKLLRERGIPVRVVLVGVPDHESLQAVPLERLNAWVAQGAAEWWGYQEDMPATLRRASIVALPTTYGEGVPKILLEAAAVGRALVSSDMPGCRSVVVHGHNGLIVKAQDSKALSVSLEELIKDPARRRTMGTRGRRRAEREFSDEQVAKATLRWYVELVGLELRSTMLASVQGTEQINVVKS